MYLKRKAYDELVAWKKRPGHSTLEVSGARQVGKTYIVSRFADEQYRNKIYINLLEISGELFLERYQELWQDMKEGQVYDNPVYELIKRYQPNFIDSEDTIVIIDEIQESADIYNRIREFTRALRCDFIVTGSYLGRILNREFKYSSGDLDALEIHTLNFEEFLTAVGRFDLYEDTDIFGGGDAGAYQELQRLYSDYCQIGGYPSVVLRYLEDASLKDCQTELLKIIRLFTNESRRYFEDILDDAVYDNIFSGVARILAKEKKGFDEDSFSEELQKIVVKDYSSNISKASVNRAIDWLYSSGIVGFVGKVIECNILDFKAKARCYFMDVGLTNYFLLRAGCPKSLITGIVNENFVYLDLRRRITHPSEIALETPAFATLGTGEIDFYAKALGSERTYALEVKSGKQAAPTGLKALDDGKVDCLLLLKGNTKGGKNGNIFTIPIYLFSKFMFDHVD
ncbi:MAG: AAA family ATPase [Ruminococcus flavefaciens]|nr:AAA family ATPase [Ruminococcus flavefaciens]